MTRIEEEVKRANTRVDYQEDYSRRNNIRVDGIEESTWETWEVTQEKVRRMLKEKLGLGDVQLERAHRVGAPNHRSPGQPFRPRTIIARFTKFADRDVTLRNSAKLKNTKKNLNEDLCEASIQARKEKLPALKTARQQGKIAYFSHTKLVIRDRHDQRRPGAGVQTLPSGVTGATAPAVVVSGGSLDPGAAAAVGVGAVTGGDGDPVVAASNSAVGDATTGVADPAGRDGSAALIGAGATADSVADGGNGHHRGGSIASRTRYQITK